MAETIVELRENGPLLVTGNIQLIDHQGNVFDLGGKEKVALCRCGHSKKRPFCDGSHKECGFIAGETAPKT